MNGRYLIPISLLSLLSLSALPCVGAEPTSTTGRTILPDDTLWQLADQCLGEAERWPELWRLNPWIADPDVLEIGRSLTMPSHCPGRIEPVEPVPEADSEPATVELAAVAPQEENVPSLAVAEGPFAVVEWIRRRVEEQRPPDLWQPSRSGSELGVGDAVRTFERAASHLGFYDEFELTLTEDSLVFLRDRRIRDRRRFGAIEVMRGTTDLRSESPVTQPTDFELRAGAAVAVPDLSSPSSHVRTRLDEAGTVRFMTYDGPITVSGPSEGPEALVLEPGTGVVLDAAGAPPVPEPLPEPPTGISTAEDEGGVTLSWSAVPGATYLVEVCLDARCVRPLLLARPAESVYRLEEQTPGSYFWRVSAVTASGLDGRPSPARELRISPPTEDPAAPSRVSAPMIALALLAAGLLVVVFGRLRRS